MRLLHGPGVGERHTAKRIGTRLEEEFGVALPYTTVRDFVTARRRAITAGCVPAEGYLSATGAYRSRRLRRVSTQHPLRASG